MWDSLIDRLAVASEPLWQTPLALAHVLGLAQAGTALFGLFMFVAALELLRSSSGIVMHSARVVAFGAAGIVGASLIFGDFLAPPARAAISLIATRLPAAHAPTALFATLGAATAGIAYGASRKSGAAKATKPVKSTAVRARLDHMHFAPAAGAVRITDMGRALMLDPAGRIQFRQLTNRPKTVAVRPVRVAGALLQIAHGPGAGRARA